MKSLKYSLAFLAAAISIAVTPSMHATPVTFTVTTSAGTQVLVGTPILNGEFFSFTNLTSATAIPGSPLDNTRLTTFLATFVNAPGPTGVLQVTEACAQVTIAGTSPVPCQALAASVTALNFGSSTLISSVGANVMLAGNVANIAFDGSVAFGGATVDFTGTPSGGNGGNSPVPEPSSLVLLGTGALSLAGAARRKFLSA